MTDEELRGHFADLRQHIDQQILETRKHAEHLNSETRHEFTIRFERLENRFDLLTESVVWLNQKIDRETADVRDELRRGFTVCQPSLLREEQRRFVT